MASKFNYISYSDDLPKIIYNDIKENNERNILLVFEDFRDKKVFIKRNKDLFIYKNCEYFTFDELKIKLYISDKILIDKDTSLMGLFMCIPSELKKEIGIKDYFQFIDFGNRFFTFFRELGKNNVEELPSDSVFIWEKTQVDFFYQVKKHFDKEMEKRGYYPSEWLEKIDHFDNRWVKKYEKIIFVDIVKFTNLDRKIIQEKLEFMNFEFYLQVKPNEFNEEKLRMNTVEFPNDLPKIDFYNVVDNTTSAFNLVNLISKDNLNKEISSHVYSPVAIENNYSKIFPNFFDKSKTQPMKSTKFYEFLELQMNLIDSIISNDNNVLVFKIEGFINCFNKSIFRKYYGISNFVELQFLELISRGYKYLSSAILEEYINNKSILHDQLGLTLLKIIDDINNVINIKDIGEVYDFYKKIIYKKKIFQGENGKKNLEKKYFLFYENGFKNIVSTFNEAAMNIKDLSNNEFFSDIVFDSYGIFVYRLFFEKIKDMNYKINNDKDEENGEISENLYTIEEITNSKYSSLKDGKRIKKGYFIDLTNTNLPNVGKENIIFTENQMEKLGFILTEEKRNIEKYRFIQNIYNFNELIFFAYINDEEKVEYSTFVEEIKLKSEKEKNIVFNEKKLDISNDDYIRILGNKFLSSEVKKFEKLQDFYKENKIQKNIDGFKKNIDLLNGELKLGAYTYNDLSSCNLRFYFKQIINLKENFVEAAISPNIDPLTRLYLGNFFHKIMENVVEIKRTAIIKNNDFNIDKNTIYSIINDLVNKDIGKKLPYYFKEYFQVALMPKLINNIMNFFTSIKEKYEGVKINSIDVEKNTGKEKIFMIKNNIEVKLDGNVDLLISTAVGNDIYDHKTGKPKDGQMDFYKIALFGNSENVKKFVFNGWDGELISEDKEHLKMEEMEEVISKFILNDILSMAESNSKGNYPICKECLYKKICGRG
ncbi:PD-(D/E)XK nuclease family protein [Fusobacterium sp. PH5-44]|uniref:PD-(D/E)XK nuclease family protein n=1 Tax=unclassified Fusobacterium TaxID=2648384 RepID=UPI003D2348DB